MYRLLAERLTFLRSCSNAKYEVLWFKCKHPKMASMFYYCVIYHPPKPIYDSKELIDDLMNDIDDLAVADPDAIISIIGDLNDLDHSKLENESGLVQLVKDVTHGKRILDKFLTNNSELFSIKTINSTIKTKHRAVLANCSAEMEHSAAKMTCRKTVSFPDSRAQHIAVLREALASYNWGAVHADGDDVDAAYNTFVCIIKELILIKNVSRSKLSLYEIHADPWFVTPLVRSLLRRRNYLYHHGRINKADALSLKIGRIIDEVRSNKFSNVDVKDSKQLWHMIKNNTNYNSKCKIQDLVISNDGQIDDINAFFTNVATDPEYDPDIIRAIVDSYSGDQLTQEVNAISEYEIGLRLSRLKKTASGPDDIPYWAFKECAFELAPIITHIINISLKAGVVPGAWKKAYVSPVPKVKNPSEFSGYADLRPISVTPILSRLVEKIVVKNYLWPLMDNEQMVDQFAFKPTGSTTAALVELLHLVHNMFDQGNDYVRCILIDFSKAFDVVNHEILLKELRTLGMNSSIFNWIADFLTGRSQAVKLGDIISAFLMITRSIVQGSGLGPYLFILLARKLKALSLINRPVKYADDMTLVVPQHTDCLIEEELKNIVTWAENNKQNINTNKTKEIIFWKTGKPSKAINIPLIPQIERVQQVRLLGVLLSSNLSFTPHIEYILAVSTQRFYLLNQLRKMSLALAGLSNVFRALIVSRILYALPAFHGFILKSDVDRSVIGDVGPYCGPSGVAATCSCRYSISGNYRTRSRLPLLSPESLRTQTAVRHRRFLCPL